MPRVTRPINSNQVKSEQTRALRFELTDRQSNQKERRLSDDSTKKLVLTAWSIKSRPQRPGEKAEPCPGEWVVDSCIN